MAGSGISGRRAADPFEPASLHRQTTSRRARLDEFVGHSLASMMTSTGIAIQQLYRHPSRSALYDCWKRVPIREDEATATCTRNTRRLRQ